MTGNAAIEAATQLRSRLFELAAEQLGTQPAQLDARDNVIFVRDDPTRRIGFVEAANLAEERFGTLGATGSYRPPRTPGRYRGAGVGPSPAYSYQACVIELHVDLDSGWPRIDHVWIAHDGGTCLNPLLVEGQVEGSVYMGLGEAMMEEMVYRKGVHRIPSLLDYKSPTALEMPPVTTFLIETRDPAGPFGGKECGQGPLLPIPPAYTNALHDAIGIRFDQVPVGPDMIALALHKQTPRVGPAGLPPIPWHPPLQVELPDLAALVEARV
jgi:CO/xanthine dehydrogenase Mo-binding subunit